jgi:nuclear pore complex protein Nup98-Nup96
MFGAPSNNNSPFGGGGGFGQQQQQQPGGFGQPTQQQQPASNPFGSPSPFGQQQQQQPTSSFASPGFGQPQQQQPGSGGFGTNTSNASPFGFGQQQQQQQPSGFGSSFAPAPSQPGWMSGGSSTQQQQPSLFGNTSASSGGGTGLFGTSSAATTPTSNTNTAFGTTTTNSLFGQQQQQPATGFGAQPGNVFGAQTNTFGAAPTTPFGGASTTFGAAPTTPFGGTSTGSTFGAPTSTFGGSTNTTFGAASTSTFGAAPTSTFGAPTTSFGGAPTSTFGAAPTNTFGASQTNTFGAAPISTFGSAPTGTFGAPTNTFGAAPINTFGAPTSTFGAAPTSLFGAPSNPTTGFQQQQQQQQQPLGAFGSPQPATSGTLFGANATPSTAVGGTRNQRYQLTVKPDGNSSIQLHSITAMQQYESASNEELRFQDFEQGIKGDGSASNMGAPPGNFGTSAPGAFGSPAPGTFGAPTPSVFGAPAPGSSFGTSAPGAFGSPAPGTFGSTTPGTFGAPAPASFGAPTAGLFGAPAPAGGLFQSPAPGGFSGFGTAPTPAPTFSAPSPGGGFGNLGGFGGPAPAPVGFGVPAPAPGMFGAPAQGGFGAPTSIGFGTPSGGLFGSAPTPAPFGMPGAAGFSASGASSPGAGLFGNSAPTQLGGFAPQPTQSSFGNATAGPYNSFAPPVAPPPTPMPNYANIIPPVETEIIAQQMRAILHQREELNKSEVWRGKSQGSPSVSTPTNISDIKDDALIGFGWSSPYLSGTARSSTTNIRPRGFSRTEPAKSSTDRDMFRNNCSIRTPEACMRLPAKQLVIRPESMKKKPLPRIMFGESTPTKENGTHARLTTASNSEEEPSPLRTPVSAPSPMQLATPFPKGLKSPTLAADYYNRVIASGKESSDATVLAVMPPVQTTSCAPKLTKEGYDVIPSKDTLAGMSDADLAAVSNFCVSRSGYGRIEWEGDVDVRNADLDEIIEIEQGNIMVYHKREASTKPALGTKLNRPAILKFYGLFPKKSAEGATEEERIEAFRKKLQRSAEKSGAKFLAYDEILGEWSIRVNHFSRYGIDDSDDEDEYTVSDNLGRKVRSKGDATPISSRIGILVDENMDTDTEETDVNMTESEVMLAVQASAQQAYKEILAYQNEYLPLSPDGVDAIVVDEITFENDGEDFIESPALPSASIPDAAMLCRAANAPSFCRRLMEKAGIHDSSIDMGIRMGRSFRIGWLPDGSFIKLGINSHGPSPVVVRSRPFFGDNVDAMASLLEVQKKYSQSTIEDSECPLYSLPEGLSSIETRYAASKLLSEKCNDSMGEVGAAFALIALLTKTESDNISDAVVDVGSLRFAYSTEARRVAAVREVLSEVSARDVDKDVAKTKGNKHAAVLVACSGGDWDKACTLAIEMGCWQLASLLSTDSGRNDVAAQVRLLADRGDWKRVAPEALQCLCSLSGDLAVDDSLYEKKARRLDWRRRLAMRLHQEPNASLSKLVDAYENDLKSKKVPFPSSLHSNGERSVLYQIIRAFANPESLQIAEVVDPKGMCVHDYSGPFHLATVMVASNQFPSFDVTQREYLLSSYETQLVNQGLWEWAVYVALFSLGPSSFVSNEDETNEAKARRAKDLVMRFYDSDNPLCSYYLDFLLNEVCIPLAWIEEALAERAAYTGRVRDFVRHCAMYDMGTATDVLECVVLPQIFFGPDDELQNWLPLIEEVAVKDESSPLAQSFYDLFNIKLLLLSRASLLDNKKLTEFADALHRTQNTLQYYQMRFQRRRFSSNGYGLRMMEPSATKPVTAYIMLNESIRHVEHMQLQVRALLATNMDSY